MKFVAAGLAALFITVSPLAQPLAHASEYSGGAKYGPLPGQTFGHHHRGAKGAGGAYAAHKEAASNHARHRGSQNRPSPGA